MNEEAALNVRGARVNAKSCVAVNAREEGAAGNVMCQATIGGVPSLERFRPVSQQTSDRAIDNLETTIRTYQPSQQTLD